MLTTWQNFNEATGQGGEANRAMICAGPEAGAPGA